MARERKLTDDEAAYLGPVAIAQFIEVGWIAQWPLCTTRGGLRAMDRGFGRDHLPMPTTRGSLGAYSWPGRKI